MLTTHNFTGYTTTNIRDLYIINKKETGLLNLEPCFFAGKKPMGTKPKPLECDDIDPVKFYIVEVEYFVGGDPLTGCQRPLGGNYHEVVNGYDLSWWVCNHLDCVDDRELFPLGSNAQRIIKCFGPWNTREEADEAMRW